VDARHFAEMPFALRVFGRKQMAPGRLRAQHFAAGGDFEPFRDCFARLAARNWLRHEARKIDAGVILTTGFVVAVAVTGDRIITPADEDIGSYNAECEINSRAWLFFSRNW